MRAGSSPTVCATPSGSRSARAPPSSGSGTSASAAGKRSTASPMCSGRSRTPAGPATRARLSSFVAARRRGHLHEPLRGRPVGGARPVLLVLAPRARSSPARPARSEAARSRASPSTREGRTRRLQQRPVLLRLLAQVHLGDAGGEQRAPEPERRRHLRRPGGRPRPARDRAGRRPVLPRLRRRDDPADPLLRSEPAADRGRPGDAHEQDRTARRELRRRRVERPRGRRAHLRVGSRRRRRVRRLDLGHAVPDLHAGRAVTVASASPTRAEPPTSPRS